MTATLPPEFLTVEQFAHKLNISRATVFAWMQKGVLTQGRHFLKIGRVLRFPWTGESLDNLLHLAPEEERPAATPKPLPGIISRKKAAPVDWDY